MMKGMIETDRRLMQAKRLTAALMFELRGLDLPHEEVYVRLLEALYRNGADLITDEERDRLGLEPRDAKGWTFSERVRYEQAKQEALMAMCRPVVTPES